MKTLLSFVAITATAALNTGLAHAQLLGGGIGGSMSNAAGGALSGSMMDRSGAMDGQFGSHQSLRAGDNFDTQPDLSRSITRSHNATERVVQNGKQKAEVAGHSATGKADSSDESALNGGASAIHAGKATAGDVNTARTEQTRSAAQTQSPPSASTAQAAPANAAMQTPSAQASGGDSAASHTHVDRGADGWSAGSQTASGANASGTVEQ